MARLTLGECVGEHVARSLDSVATLGRPDFEIPRGQRSSQGTKMLDSIRQHAALLLLPSLCVPVRTGSRYR
jgi:hypothetical protein